MRSLTGAPARLVAVVAVALTAVVAAPGASAKGCLAFSDPRGDAGLGVGGTAVSVDSWDILGAIFIDDGKALRITMRVADLVVPAPGDHLGVRFTFSFRRTDYPAYTLVAAGYAEGARFTVETAKGSAEISGEFDAAADTVRFVAPFSVFGHGRLLNGKIKRGTRLTGFAASSYDFQGSSTAPATFYGGTHDDAAGKGVHVVGRC